MNFLSVRQNQLLLGVGKVTMSLHYFQKTLKIGIANKITVTDLIWNSLIFRSSNVSKRCRWNGKQCRP